MGHFLSTSTTILQYDELNFDQNNYLNKLSENTLRTIIAKKNTTVFTINGIPNVVFKQSKFSNGIENRFQNIKYAQKICDDYNLNKLIIPKAKLIMIDGILTLVEEYYDFNPTESFQKELYFLGGAELDETIRQLTFFIAKSGFYDVTWRNIPIYWNRVVLIDLEHLNNSSKSFGPNLQGFVGGGNGSCGLLGCVSSRHFDIVISELKKLKISFNVTQIKKYNEHEQYELKMIKKFYKENNIISGYEPLQIRQSLSYSSVDKKFHKQLAKLTCDVVTEINEQIQQSDKNDTPVGKRYLLLNTNDPEKCCYKMDTTLLFEKKEYKTDDDYYNATCLGIVIQKLIDVGLIYKLIKRNGHGYFIQT